MRYYLHMIKRWDIIIIALLILASFLPLAIFTMTQKNVDPDAKVYAVISVDNNVFKEVELTHHKGTKTILYKNKEGDYNLIEVKDQTIRIKDADCGDLVCVRVGAISKPGETIVCLPHRLVIEIKSSNATPEDDDEIIIPS